MIQFSSDKLETLDCRVIVHPTAGGKIRGAHNCGKCDSDVVSAIERYSVSGDVMEFSNLECSCKSHWRAEIENDTSFPLPLGFGTFRRGSVLDIVRAP